jgi:hypothetical protein
MIFSFLLLFKPYENKKTPSAKILIRVTQLNKNIYNLQNIQIIMEKEMLFGGLSLICFASILFVPENSNSWIWLVILGLIFGILWYKFK